MKKDLLNVIKAAVMLAIIIAIFQTSLFETEGVRFALITVFIIVFSVTLIFSLVKIFRFIKRQKDIIKILQEEKDVDRYILEMEKLSNETKNIQNRKMLTISLAAGYTEKNDYNMAFHLMSSVDPVTLQGMGQVYYFLNLAIIKYYSGEAEEAKAIMELKENIFQNQENHPELGYYITTTKLYIYILKNEISKAKEYLNKAERLSKNPYMKDRIDFLKAAILMKENCTTEANIIIERLKESKQTPLFQTILMTLEKES